MSRGFYSHGQLPGEPSTKNLGRLPQEVFSWILGTGYGCVKNGFGCLGVGTRFGAVAGLICSRCTHCLVCFIFIVFFSLNFYYDLTFSYVLKFILLL